ncbi:DNA-binding protein [Solibacillus sp. CAU 1738]|uniref:DNA-binding protein n=1 Tax=Solibacillus sp. CAU 1738 TaxID=3140363 RepID=UPI0032600514
MYKSVAQTAQDLNMPVEQVMHYIYVGRIKAVHDGEQFLVNSGQFDTYHQQIERIKEEIEIWRNTPIPDDIDVKDED